MSLEVTFCLAFLRMLLACVHFLRNFDKLSGHLASLQVSLGGSGLYSILRKRYRIQLRTHGETFPSPGYISLSLCISARLIALFP